MNPLTGIPTVECSGLGSCVRFPPQCTSSDPMCTASCQCGNTAAGSACSVAREDLPDRAEVRGKLIAAMAQTAGRIDTSSTNGVLRFAETLSEVVGDGTEIAWAAGPGASQTTAVASEAANTVVALVHSLLSAAASAGGVDAAVLDALTDVSLALGIVVAGCAWLTWCVLARLSERCAWQPLRPLGTPSRPGKVLRSSPLPHPQHASRPPPRSPLPRYPRRLCS